MSWSPNTEALKDIVDTFNASKSADNEVQKSVFKKLEAYESEPEYSNYLVFIIMSENIESFVRIQAGLNLKNLVMKKVDSLSVENQEFIKRGVLLLLKRGDKDFKNIINPIIASLIKCNTIHRYPEVLTQIYDDFTSQDENKIMSGLSILHVLMEDCPSELDQEVSGLQPLITFIPMVIDFIAHPKEKVRILAIEVGTVILSSEVSAMEPFLEPFSTALFHRTSDLNLEVHTVLCRAFITLLNLAHMLILPNLNYIAEYMFKLTQDEDLDLALEACEFWLAIAEHEQVYEYLRPYIPNLIPVLVNGMIYTEDEIEDLKLDMKASSQPDREQDIKPSFHQSKVHNQTEEEEDDDDLFQDSVWNIRKCSAASLDQIASLFGNDLLEFLIPLLKQKLYHEKWEHRECGILVLGAISEGCMTGLEPHLPDLIPYLIKSADEEEPLIRIITCWSISRYSEFICSPHHANDDQFFKPSLQALLRRLTDPVKKVQEAGTSSASTFIQSSGDKLIPYIKDTIDCIIMAFPSFQPKNVIVLLDFISSFALSVEKHLDQPTFVETLMVPLIKKYNEISDDDRILPNLFECFSSIATSVGSSFAPYAQPIYERSIKIIANILNEIKISGEDGDFVSRDNIVVCLDLIAVLVQCLGTNINALINSTQPHLIQILAMCLNDPDKDSKQSAYALLGDLAIHSYETISPQINDFVRFMVDNFDSSVDYNGVANNLVWSFGEIIIHAGSSIAQVAQPLLEKFIVHFTHKKIQANLSENLAIAIGRFALVVPEMVAPHIEKFANHWFESMVGIPNNTEKDSAFQGICIIAKQNPSGYEKSILMFIACILNCKHPSARLDALFRETLTMYKNLLGTGWDSIKSKFSPETQAEITARFNV